MAHISKIGSGEFTIEFWLKVDEPTSNPSMGQGLHGVFSTLNEGNVADGPLTTPTTLETYSNGIVGGFALGYIYNYPKFYKNKFGENIGDASGFPQNPSRSDLGEHLVLQDDHKIRLVWLDGVQIGVHGYGANAPRVKISTQQEFFEGGHWQYQGVENSNMNNIPETTIFGASSSPQAGDDQIRQSTVFLGNKTTEIKYTNSVEGNDDGLVITPNEWTHIAVTRKNDVVVPSISRPNLYSTQVGKTLDSIEFYIDGKKKARIFIPKDADYTVDKELFRIGEFFGKYERSSVIQTKDFGLKGAIDLFTIYDNAERTADFTPPAKPAGDGITVGGGTVTIVPQPETNNNSPRNTTTSTTRYRSLIVYENLQGQPVTGIGPIIIPDPTIDECFVNDCCNHYVQTGTRSTTKIPQRYLSSGNVVIEEPSVPFHTTKNFIDVADAGVEIIPPGAGGNVDRNIDSLVPSEHKKTAGNELVFGLNSVSSDKNGVVPTVDSSYYWDLSRFANENPLFGGVSNAIVVAKGKSTDNSTDNVPKWKETVSLNEGEKTKLLRYDGVTFDAGGVNLKGSLIEYYDSSTPDLVVTTDAGTEFDWGTSSDFTIEGYFRFLSFRTLGGTAVDSIGQIQRWNGLVNRKTADNGSYRGWVLAVNQDGQILFDANDTSSTIELSSSVGAVALNTWYHIAIVRNGGTTKLYLDGTELDSVADTVDYTHPKTTNSVAPITLGNFYLYRSHISNRHNDSTYTFNGYSEEVRISNTARYTSAFTPNAFKASSADQIRFVSDSNTLLLVGNSKQDRSPNGMLMKDHGLGAVNSILPPSQSDILFAQKGLALHFNGQGYLQVGNWVRPNLSEESYADYAASTGGSYSKFRSEYLSGAPQHGGPRHQIGPQKSWTFEMWFYRAAGSDSLQHNSVLISAGSGGTSNSFYNGNEFFAIEIGGTQNSTTHRKLRVLRLNKPSNHGNSQSSPNTSAIPAFGTTSLEEEKWHHVALVRDTTQEAGPNVRRTNSYHLYLDGQLELSFSTSAFFDSSSAVESPSDGFYLGARVWDDKNFRNVYLDGNINSYDSNIQEGDPSHFFNGYMDHIYFHRGGTPRYDGPFVPPYRVNGAVKLTSSSPNSNVQNGVGFTQASCFFESGYLTTEISDGFDYYDTGKNFTVEFWTNFENHNTGIGINNVPLFSFVNEQKHQIGLGYRIDDTDRNKRTLMFYENNSGIEHTGFNYTGWFTETGKWYHVAVTRDDDGYKAFQGTYGTNVGPTGGTGVQYGNTISLESLESHWPTGDCRFVLGGLLSGTFTGNNNDYTEEFSNDAYTVLLSNFNESISDESSNSFSYEIVSGEYKDSLGNDPVYAVISGLDGLVGRNNVSYGLEPKQGTGFLTVNPGEKNSTSYVDGQNNHKLDSYSYIESTGFNFGTGDFSVECWIKPRGDHQALGNRVQPSNKECVVWAIGDFGNAWQTGNGIALTYNNFFDQDELSLCFGSNLGINKFRIAANTDMRFGWLGVEYENELPWHHVLVQRLSGNFECYLNGNLFETVTTKDLTEHALTKYSITSAPDINNPDQKFFLGGMNQAFKVFEYPSDTAPFDFDILQNRPIAPRPEGTSRSMNVTGIYSFVTETGRELRSGLSDLKYLSDSGNVNFGQYYYGLLDAPTAYPNFYGKPQFDHNFTTNSPVYKPVRFYPNIDTGENAGYYTFKIPVTGVGPNETSTVDIEADFASWQPFGVGTVLGLGTRFASWHMTPVLAKTRNSHSHRITYGVNNLDQEERWSMPSRRESDYTKIHADPRRSAIPGDWMMFAVKDARGIQLTPSDQEQYTAENPKIHNFNKSFTVRSGDNIMIRYYKDGGVALNGFSKWVQAYDAYTSHSGVKVARGTKIVDGSMMPNVVLKEYRSYDVAKKLSREGLLGNTGPSLGLSLPGSNLVAKHDNINSTSAYMRMESSHTTFWPSTERCEPLSIKAKLGASEISSYHGHIDSLRVSNVARFSDYVNTGDFSGYLDADIQHAYIDELRISDSGRYTGEYGTTGYFYTDTKTQLLCHFNEHSGVIDFFDEHCGKTGKHGNPLSGRVGDMVGTFGQALYDVTGIQVGDNRINAEEWNVISQDYLCFRIPAGATSGPYYLMSDQYDEVTGCDLSLDAPEFKVLDFNPKTGHIGTEISISGSALHLATSVAITGDNSSRLFPAFNLVDTTGINFTVPSAAVTSKITVSANRIDEFQEKQTSEELVVIKTGISLLDTTSGAYNQLISLSGTNLDSGTQSIFFEGFTTGERNLVEPLSTTFIGNTGVQVKVPREIIRGSITLSGVESFVETSEQFTPIPTISGFHNTNLVVGQPFRLSGINASEIVPVLGFSGDSSQPYYESDNIVEFVSNPAIIVDIDAAESPLQKERTFRFGPIDVDTSQIEASAPNSYQTGYTIVTGLINSVVNGTGFPFLVSAFDSVSGALIAEDFITEFENGFRAIQFSEHFRNGSGITHSLLPSVTGDKITISGVNTNIIGIDPSRGDKKTEIFITGENFYNLTGIRLTDVPSESSECFIESGDFVPQTGEYITLDAEAVVVTQNFTGFHILNLGDLENVLTVINTNQYKHGLLFKVCDSFITSNVDQAYIYSMESTGTTGELTIPS